MGGGFEPALLLRFLLEWGVGVYVLIVSDIDFHRIKRMSAL